MLLTGLGLLLIVGGTAAADPPTGGCTGSVNGRPAATLTKSNPLKVKEHTTVSAEGSTPPGKSGPNQTHVKVFLIDPFGGITSGDHEGDGDTWSSSTVQVDDYLKYGVGTYKVEVTNRGSGWSCTFVGYVQLKGNPLTKPVGIAAAGLTAIGAAGGLLAPRRKVTPAWQQQQTQAMYAKRSPMDTILEEGDKVIAAADAPPPPPPDSTEVALAHIQRSWLSCLGCAIALVLMPARVMPIVGMGGGAGIAAAPTGPVLWRERVWLRGRPIAGFFSGLVFGIGGTVLLWQYNVWLLNTLTAIALPIAAGIVFGAYAWIGRPFDVVARPSAAPPPPAPAATPTIPRESVAPVAADIDTDVAPPPRNADDVDPPPPPPPPPPPVDPPEGSAAVTTWDEEPPPPPPAT